MPAPARAALAVALLVGGAVVGVASVAVHGRTFGLVLALLATAAAAHALPGGWSTRGAFGLGWCGLVAVALRTRPEGDYLIGANGAGYVLLSFTILLLLYCIVTLRPGPADTDP